MTKNMSTVFMKEMQGCVVYWEAKVQTWQKWLR